LEDWLVPRTADLPVLGISGRRFETITSGAGDMTPPWPSRKKIPRDPENDYTPAAAEARRAFLRAQTGAGLEHVSRYSFAPSILPGNIEHFTGVAQVPIGIAGPLLVNGSMRRVNFTFRWPRPRAPWSRATTGG
jgi:hypothetical protein